MGRKKTEGMTFIGMLLTMAIVIMAAIVVMRATPLYLQYYEIVSSIKSLNSLPATDFSQDPAANATLFKNKLINQLYVNSIDYITYDQLIIVPDGENRFKISITYQVTRPLFGNVRLLFDFSTSQEVKISA
ncbi:MAG: DUF4845 domain-containing protein [Legionellales bacterium]|nr:DUF4845 domain-containing protein [Legionellales bacterium]